MISLSKGEYLGDNQLRYDAGGIILTQTEYRQKAFEGWHAHENNHLSLIIRGGNREERKGCDTTAQPGTLLFYHREELHRNLHTVHPSKNINLEITREFMQRYELGESDLEKMARNPAAPFSLLKMYHEAGQRDQLSGSAIHTLLLWLLADTEKLRRKEPPVWLKTVVGFLEENWQSHIGLDELAAIAGVNPITISKHFPAYMGCTLGEYRRRLKIGHALRMIPAGTLSLTGVACHCGFADQSHFTRNFRELTCLLPKAYQKL